MKKIKYIIIGIFIGIFFSGVAVFASSTFSASQITYKNTTLDLAIDELYEVTPTTKVCKYESNEYGNSANHLSLGTEYVCDVNLNGSGKKNFYVLSVTGDTVTLIMKHNETEGSSKTTFTWMEAMDYIRSVNWKVKPDLPTAQLIANAAGNTSWKAENKDYTDYFCLGTGFNQNCYGNSTALSNDTLMKKNAYLFNYFRECANYGCKYSLSASTNSNGKTEAYGYWTRDIIAQNSETAYHRAWNVDRRGGLGLYSKTTDTYYGVRPIITVLKSNLYE